MAWSSFSTGTHPARHNIFDFLDRDRRTYLPMLSSTRIGKVERFLKIGKYRIPLQKPELRLLRRSKPFWTILGEHRIWSTMLRVPITFPPDHFYGAELSAMCVPDLLGTQGTFLLYTTRPPAEKLQGRRHAHPRLARRRPDGTRPSRGPENTFLEGSPASCCRSAPGSIAPPHAWHVTVGDVTLTLDARRTQRLGAAALPGACPASASGVSRACW